jgi:hypothetical protein
MGCKKGVMHVDRKYPLSTIKVGEGFFVKKKCAAQLSNLYRDAKVYGIKIKIRDNSGDAFVARIK